jgi:hypothetical protein
VHRFKLLAAITTVAALAAPALAPAAVKTYGGKIKGTGGEGRIALDVRIKNRRPKGVLETRFYALPVDCDVSGDQFVLGEIGGEPPIPVENRRFRVEADDGQGNSLLYTGRFSRDRRNVAGRLALSHHFTQPEEETCVSDVHDYSARRGGPDVQVRPALRILPALG